jgi:hypothetical protein
MRLVFILATIVWGLAGCSRQLALVKPPQIDAAGAAEGVLRNWDTDHDGQLSRSEARACRGINDNWTRYDPNNDGQASRQELESRFAAWSSGDTGLMNLRVQVTFRKQPLTEAQVHLVPCDFLGPHFLPAKGTTDRYGYAFMAIPDDQLPASQRGTHGMQVGLYRVMITHPAIQPPDKYSEQSALSVDLSPAEANSGVSFNLD